MGNPEDVRMPQRRLGRTGLEVTSLCIGGSPLAALGDANHEGVPRERGIATVQAVFDGPINFLDTGNSYSAGESESRVGAAIAESGGLPDGFVLATKLDRDLTTGEYTGERMWRSIEESLGRLGVSSVPLLHLHDPEHIGFEAAMAPGGPAEALMAMREQGIAEHVGIAGGPADLLLQFVRTDLFEILLTHNRWTLVDRSAGALIDEAFSRGVGVLNAAVFGGGILARGGSASTRYAYREARPETIAAVREAEAACARHGVGLAVAALQWSVRDPRIGSTIVGASRPDRVAALVQQATAEVPEELWDELAGLAAPEAVWLH